MSATTPDHDELRPEDTWPVVIATGEYSPMLCTSTLDKSQKIELWDHLRRSHPETAANLALLSKDSLVMELVELYGAGFCIDPSQVPTSLK